MKNIPVLLFFSILSLIFLQACSSQDTQQSDGTIPNKDSAYVFDEIVIDTTSTVPSQAFEDNKSAEAGEKMKANPAWVKTDRFTVQLGAFSTKARADEFYELAKSKINKAFIIYYSTYVKLFVVQMQGSYTKPEADKAVERLRKMKEFKDSFVVPYYEGPKE